ncbi:hypothetical protein QBC41DRAFT_323164 [Cercophora samala]|uniref:Uncharacterized protein n=1 Tax=Cercophora samala TaxID=330535 RepID=A0AA40DBP7_9PEZI|nr:hypothetical protein QBC41DRAFT_323164 [Cercophora samala]
MDSEGKWLGVIMLSIPLKRTGSGRWLVRCWSMQARLGGESSGLWGVTEWPNALAGEDDAEKYPTLKLKEFFEGWRDEKQGELVFETYKARETSRKMREMRAVSGEMMGRWLDVWSF